MKTRMYRTSRKGYEALERAHRLEAEKCLTNTCSDSRISWLCRAEANYIALAHEEALSWNAKW